MALYGCQNHRQYNSWDDCVLCEYLALHVKGKNVRYSEFTFNAWGYFQFYSMHINWFVGQIFSDSAGFIDENSNNNPCHNTRNINQHIFNRYMPIHNE